MKHFVQYALYLLFYLLNTQIGHALVHHKIGFFRFVVCLFSYVDRGFWFSYVSHDVPISLLSPTSERHER